LLLLAALVAVIVIRQMGGFSFSKMFDSVAPPSPSPEQRPFQHLEVKR
jgi:hypothetical protein